MTAHRYAAVALAAGIVFAVALIAVELHLGWAHAADVAVLRHLNSATAHHPASVTTWRAVSAIFQPTTWRVLAAAVAVVALVRRQFRTAIIVVITAGGAALLSGIVKSAVGRPRPIPPTVIEHVNGWSFPSGHALAAAAIGTVVVAVVPWPRGRLRIVAVSLVVLAVAAVATSRLALGVHYLSDVVGGLALGGCWAALTLVVGSISGSPNGEQDEGPDTGSDAVGAEGSQ